MTDRTIAATLHDDIIEANAFAYRDMLENAASEDATDPYWAELIPFYRQQDEAGQSLILGLMMQCSIDAVSSLLGLIDAGELVVAGGQELQDAFLAEDEQRQGE